MKKGSSYLKLSILTIAMLMSSLWAKDYKGAELYSKEEITYGRWEMRMMAAKGSGVLSTFFLYKNGSEKKIDPWEEVDIEIKGKDNGQFWQSNIITGTGNIHSDSIHGPANFADQFYTFVVEWTPGKVVWKVNGEVIRTTEGGQADNLISPMGYRFNLWSHTSEAWVGAFDPAILPVYQYVNWVEYSAYTKGQGPNGSDFTVQWRDDFNDLDGDRWAFANWTFNENRVDFSPDNIITKDGMLILALTTTNGEGVFGNVPVDNGDESSSILMHNGKRIQNRATSRVQGFYFLKQEHMFKVNGSVHK